MMLSQTPSALFDSGATAVAPTAVAPTAAAMATLGAALAELLVPGDTVLLGGDLGAGKTTFTKGLAQALGVVEPVTSPTFVLVHSYRTARGWALLHADVWRLEQLQEVIDLAIPELLEEGAVAVVEWGELAAPALGPDHLLVSIDFEGPAGVDSSFAEPGAEGTRRVLFQGFGTSWASRSARLANLAQAADQL